MNYRKWLIEDLQNLDSYKFQIKHARDELEALEAEYTAIKATNYDKMPSGNGDNIQEEKMLTVIAKKDELQKTLKATEMEVANMERLLAQLDDDEIRIIERTIIRKEKYAADSLADELGYERTQIWRLKNKALNHLARLKFGVSYRP